MRTICSFCGSVIHDGAGPDDEVSHGVCTTCHRQILTRYGFNAEKFLNLFDAPVLLVDNDARVFAANRLAAVLADKPLHQGNGTFCGDVLDCINAFLESGCGKTRFCPDCTFRNSINETYATGCPVTDRPATLCRVRDGSDEAIRMLVSTRKDGDMVLLRLRAAPVH